MGKIVLSNKTYSSSQNLLADVHKDLEVKVSGLTKNREKDRADAKIIEYVLQAVKTPKAKIPLNKLFLQQLQQGQMGQVGKELFNFSGMNSYQAGQTFEENFTQIINEIIRSSLNSFYGEEMVKEIASNEVAMILGKELQTSGVGMSKESYRKNAGKYFKEQTLQMISEASKGDELYVQTAKQGKTDVAIKDLGELNFSFEPTGTLQRFYNAIRGATFSLKNYTMTSQAMRVGLGHTSNIRLFSSILKFLGYSNTDIETIYFSSIRYSRSEAHREHKKHMIFLYELTGAGQEYVNKEIQKWSQVKFLVVNDRKGAHVRVYSTADLIHQFFKNGDAEKKISFSNSGYLTIN